MNEQWLKAIRELLEAERNLKRQGQTLPDEAKEAFLRNETGGALGWEDARTFLSQIDTGVNARNLTRSAIQGLGFNFADEALGIFNPRAAEEMRLREDLFRAEHPVADFTAGVAGGFATGLGGFGKAGVKLGAKATKSVGQAVRRGAATGAASGALGGAGMGDSMDERAANALAGGLGGTVLGAAIPGAIGGFRSTVLPSGRADARLRAAADASGGEDALFRRLADFRETGRGDLVTPADLSPQLRAEGEFAMHNDDLTRSRMLDFLQGRSEGSSERLLGDTRALLGDEAVDASGRMRDLQASRRQWADEAYGDLRANYPDISISRRMNEYLTQPRVVSMWDQAHDIGLIGKRPDTAELSFSKAQNIREQLQTAIEQAHNRGAHTLRENLREVLEGFDRTLGNQVPEFRSVRAEYHRRMELERALEAGVDAWRKNDIAELNRTVAEMAPEALEEFRIGLAGQLVEQLGSASQAIDMARRIAQASPSTQRKLQIIFGDEATLQNYLRRVGVERDMTRLNRAAYGSDTHRRGMQQVDPLGVLAQGTLGADSMAATAGSAAASGIRRLGARSTARNIGEQVFRPGADATEDWIRNMYTRGLGYSNALQYGAPSAASLGLINMIGNR